MEKIVKITCLLIQSLDTQWLSKTKSTVRWNFKQNLHTTHWFECKQRVSRTLAKYNSGGRGGGSKTNEDTGKRISGRRKEKWS